MQCLIEMLSNSERTTCRTQQNLWQPVSNASTNVKRLWGTVLPVFKAFDEMVLVTQTTVTDQRGN